MFLEQRWRVLLAESEFIRLVVVSVERYHAEFGMNGLLSIVGIAGGEWVGSGALTDGLVCFFVRMVQVGLFV